MKKLFDEIPYLEGGRVILRKITEDDREALQEMVKEVNETQVEDVEVLSDSVYCYLKDEEKLCLAADAFKAA